MFRIDITSNKALYEQVIDGIKELSMKGILKEGDKLPSVRKMAKMLEINPNTVSRAYKELEQQGFIHTVVGRGSFLTDYKNIPIDKNRLEEVLKELREVYLEFIHLGYDLEKVKVELEKIDRALKKEV